jgi:drug/metabolite transporter (DMT)-like permease
VVVIGVMAFGMRLSRRAAVACAVAVAGTVLVVGPSAGSGEPIGVVFGLAGAVIYAVYILLGSRVLVHVNAITASTVIMTTAAAGYALLYVLSPHRPHFPDTGKGWAAVVTLALVSTVIAVVTFLAGLARVGPADASTLSTVEPVVSVVLSAIVTGEDITAWTVTGGLLIVGSVLVLSRATVPVTAATPSTPP